MTITFVSIKVRLFGQTFNVSRQVGKSVGEHYTSCVPSCLPASLHIMDTGTSSKRHVEKVIVY